MAWTKRILVVGCTLMAAFIAAVWIAERCGATCDLEYPSVDYEDPGPSLWAWRQTGELSFEQLSIRLGDPASTSCVLQFIGGQLGIVRRVSEYEDPSQEHSSRTINFGPITFVGSMSNSPTCVYSYPYDGSRASFDAMPPEVRSLYATYTGVWVSAWLLILLFGTYPAYLGIVLPIRRRVRRRASACLNCGYNLTGNVSGVCPECGVPRRLAAPLDPGVR